MGNTPAKRRTGGESGTLPRIDIEREKQHEPPEPATLPEIYDDPAGITGIIPQAAEGEDEAKHADDSEITRR